MILQASQSSEYPTLPWPELFKGTLVKRYKRFLADVILEDGRMVTAHCPNTGTMLGCCEPGRPVWLSHHTNPKRKLRYTWELIQMPESLVGVNTLVPNRLVALTVKKNAIAELSGYGEVKAEAAIGNHSRIDLLLSEKDRRKCLVEIKNCTLVDDATAYFPDAVTTRGLKHLQILDSLVSEQQRCVMVYFIQRMDAAVFKPADHIDPAYGRALRRAADHGVELLAYDVHIDFRGVRLRSRVPIKL